MFFFFAVTSGTRELGRRRCRYLPCCGIYGAEVSVTCAYQRFILFFIPLFRFGKRYFASCANCGAVFELTREEGRRIERDPSAEIDPSAMFRVSSGAAPRFCPRCGARVAPGDRFCPNCGERL